MVLALYVCIVYSFFMIDTHSHIYSPEFAIDSDSMVERAITNDVEAIYMPNIDLDSIHPMLSLEARYPGYCFAMMGLHPTSVKDDYELSLAKVTEWLESRHFCAIGEIGIDLYWDQTYKNQQVEAFEAQLALAVKHSLPVVIHCRDAFPEVFASVEKYLNGSLSGIFHSFSGSVADVERINSYGTFLFGINGIVTFKNSSIVESVKAIPLEKIVAETDAPYLAPVPHRGRRNEPSYLPAIVGKLAEIYSLPFDEMVQITKSNSLRIFNKL